MSKTPSSLYIHIPFCAQKCAYCDFVSFASDPEFRASYMEMLCKELSKIGTEYGNPALKTIFVGGGTPSLLNENEIEKLGQTLDKAFKMETIEEFSIEANPGTVEAPRLRMWKQIGVNRVSMGVQSMNNELLKKLGRIHTADIVGESFDILRKSGFENINLDIMFGLPDQTVEDMVHTVKEVIELGPEHVSAYSLKIEEGTPFDKLAELGKIKLPTEDEDREMYHTIIDLLSEAGYSQYEISNFAKDGKSCKHNLVYWRGEEYFAAGMAAHGYVESRRQGNFIDWLSYKEAVEQGEFPIMMEETIDPEDAAFEFIMLGLRLNEGVDLEMYRKRFGHDLLEKYKAVVEAEKSKQTLVVENGFMRLTEYGMDVANSVITEFMDD